MGSITAAVDYITGNIVNPIVASTTNDGKLLVAMGAITVFLAFAIFILSLTLADLVHQRNKAGTPRRRVDVGRDLRRTERRIEQIEADARQAMADEVLRHAPRNGQ